jgi:sRNA-binding regulator protein Hfq
LRAYGNKLKTVYKHLISWRAYGNKFKTVYKHVIGWRTYGNKLKTVYKHAIGCFHKLSKKKITISYSNKLSSNKPIQRSS